MVYLFLADGFEEMETITAFDVLQRCGLEVKLLSITGKRVVIGGHGLILKVDGLFRKNVVENAQALVLPGGMPAAKTLLNCDLLRQALVQHNHKGTLLAAICAAPMVLGEMVVEDENVITACGPAAAEAFAFTIARRLVGNEKVEEARRTMQYKKL